MHYSENQLVVAVWKKVFVSTPSSPSEERKERVRGYSLRLRGILERKNRIRKLELVKRQGFRAPVKKLGAKKSTAKTHPNTAPAAQRLSAAHRTAGGPLTSPHQHTVLSTLWRVDPVVPFTYGANFNPRRATKNPHVGFTATTSAVDAETAEVVAVKPCGLVASSTIVALLWKDRFSIWHTPTGHALAPDVCFEGGETKLAVGV